MHERSVRAAQCLRGANDVSFDFEQKDSRRLIARREQEREENINEFDSNAYGK